MKTRIAFSRFGKGFFFATVAISLGLWVVVFLRGGFNLGIDFTSGEKYEVLLKREVAIDAFARVLETQFDKVVVQRLDSSIATNTSTGDATVGDVTVGDTSAETNSVARFAYSVKLASEAESLTQERVDEFIEAIEKEYGEVELLGSSFISGTISANLVRSSIILVLSAIALILAYIWFRFKLQYALASIVALAHDALFVVGIIGAFQIEVTAATIAAVLTIIGYSLNDTIVIFDRVRENFEILKGESLTRITDTSLNATLSRTLITSITTLLAATALFVFSVGDVQSFALTLMIGVLEGTWSSIFIAVPMLHFLGKSLVAQEAKRHGSAITQKANVGLSNTKNTGSVLGTMATKKHTNNSTETTSPLSKSAIERLRSEMLTQKKHKKK